MNTVPSLPAQASAWLHAVSAQLSEVDPVQRDEIVDGLRSHIQESIDAGADVDSVLAQLGDPATVADEAVRDDPSQAPHYLNAKRVLQIVAAALALIATVALCVLPSYVSVTTDSRGHEKIETQPLLAVMGPAYLLVLLIPVAITVVPLFLHGRAWKISSIVAAVLLGGFAILGAVSIGRYYLPAGIIEIIAACLPLRSRRHERRIV
ncbi:HAAS signaling domain-containing protein [Microbacterium xylanilyticum]